MRVSKNTRIKSVRAVPVDYHRALLKILKLESAPIRYGKSIKDIAEALGRHPDTVERAMRYLVAKNVVVKKRPPWYLRPDGRDSRTALYFFSEGSDGLLAALGMEEAKKLITTFDAQPDADRRSSANRIDGQKIYEFSSEELEALVEEAAGRAVRKYAQRRRVRKGLSKVGE